MTNNLNMKISKILSILFLTSITFFSCKKEGCTDPTALNYNAEAQKDNGNCEYNSDEYTLSGQISSDLTSLDKKQ